MPERLLGRATNSSIPEEPKSFDPPEIIILADKIPMSPIEQEIIAQMDEVDEGRAVELLSHQNMNVRLAARKRLATIRWSFAKSSKTEVSKDE